MRPTTSPDGERVRAYVSLGSNIRPYRNLPRAVELLVSRLEVSAVSSLYASAAKGAPGTPEFLNAAVEIETGLTPEVLKFEVLRPLEAEMGRVRSEDPNAPRVIDLDLSLYAELVIERPDRGLLLPDPDILTSGHVVLPLAEIAPDLPHPVTGTPLAELAAPFAAAGEVRRVGAIDPPRRSAGSHASRADR